jgi:hypothetical protein
VNNRHRRLFLWSIPGTRPGTGSFFGRWSVTKPQEYVRATDK